MRVRVRVRARVGVGVRVGAKVRARVRVKVGGVGAGPTQEAGRRLGLADACLREQFRHAQRCAIAAARAQRAELGEQRLYHTRLQPAAHTVAGRAGRAQAAALSIWYVYAYAMCMVYAAELAPAARQRAERARAYGSGANRSRAAEAARGSPAASRRAPEEVMGCKGMYGNVRGCTGM